MSHYETLQVSHDAGDQVIRAAYKALAQQWHPDKHPNKQTAELRFKEIAEAYRVLSDPALRRLYDEGHFAGGRKGAKEGVTQREKDVHTSNKKVGNPKDSVVVPVIVILLFLVFLVPGIRSFQEFDLGVSVDSDKAISESKSPLPAQNAFDPNSEVQKKYFSESQRIISSQGGGVELSTILNLALKSELSGDDSHDFVENLQRMPSIKWVSPSEKCLRNWSCLRAEFRVALHGFELPRDADVGGAVTIWEIEIFSKRSAELYPEYISLSPRCDTVQCQFNFENYLNSLPFQFKKVCNFKGQASLDRTIYEIRRGGGYFFAISDDGFGSGGTNSHLYIQYLKPSVKSCEFSSIFDEELTGLSAPF